LWKWKLSKSVNQKGSQSIIDYHKEAEPNEKGACN